MATRNYSKKVLKLIQDKTKGLHSEKEKYKEHEYVEFIDKNEKGEDFKVWIFPVVPGNWVLKWEKESSMTLFRADRKGFIEEQELNPKVLGVDWSRMMWLILKRQTDTNEELLAVLPRPAGENRNDVQKTKEFSFVIKQKDFWWQEVTGERGPSYRLKEGNPRNAPPGGDLFEYLKEVPKHQLKEVVNLLEETFLVLKPKKSVILKITEILENRNFDIGIIFNRYLGFGGTKGKSVYKNLFNSLKFEYETVRMSYFNKIFEPKGGDIRDNQLEDEAEGKTEETIERKKLVRMDKIARIDEINRELKRVEAMAGELEKKRMGLLTQKEKILNSKD